MTGGAANPARIAEFGRELIPRVKAGAIEIDKLSRPQARMNGENIRRYTDISPDGDR
jgi:hypothetical protein